MADLLDYCALVRSKNAGPFTITFDFMCHDRETYDALVALDVITAQRFAVLFHTSPHHVLVVAHERALAIKVSLPRPTIQGSLRDADSYAGQQYAPLMSIEVPAFVPAAKAGAEAEAAS